MVPNASERCGPATGERHQHLRREKLADPGDSDRADLVVRQLEVHTVFGAPPDAWAHTVRVFAAGLLDPLPLVTHELPLAEFSQAIELVGAGDPKVGKVLLRP